VVRGVHVHTTQYVGTAANDVPLHEVTVDPRSAVELDELTTLICVRRELEQLNAYYRGRDTLWLWCCSGHTESLPLLGRALCSSARRCGQPLDLVVWRCYAGLFLAADRAAVHHAPRAAQAFNADRLHQAAAGCLAVTGGYIHVLGPQALVAVVANAGRMRRHGSTAAFAGERLVSAADDEGHA